MSLGSFAAAHGAHAAEIVAPAAWIASVIVRERRRHPAPGSSPAGPAGAARRPDPLAATAPAGDRRERRIATAATALVVLGTVGAAAVHASIAPQHYSEGLIYGLFFTGLAAGQLVMAGVIAWRRDLRVVAVLAAGNVATIALWLLTRLVGIPGGPESGTREAFASQDILASALEALTVAAALVLLRRSAANAPSPKPTGSGGHIASGRIAGGHISSSASALAVRAPGGGHSDSGSG